MKWDWRNVLKWRMSRVKQWTSGAKELNEDLNEESEGNECMNEWMMKGCMNARKWREWMQAWMNDEWMHGCMTNETSKRLWWHLIEIRPQLLQRGRHIRDHNPRTKDSLWSSADCRPSHGQLSLIKQATCTGSHKQSRAEGPAPDSA